MRVPSSPEFRCLVRFREDGTWEQINHYVVMLDREPVGRDANPTTFILDSENVRTTES